MPDNSDKDHIVRESWRKLVDPQLLKDNLIRASLFLLAFEILNTSIIDQIRSFYNLGQRENEPDDPDYIKEVLGLGKGKLSASISWLAGREVLDQNDVQKFGDIRKHRNEIAHELPKFITEHSESISEPLFLEILRLVTKIDRWWFIEFEVPVNSDFDGKEVSPDGVQSGNMIFLGMLVQIALGKSEEERGMYHKVFSMLWEQKGASHANE